MHTNATDDGNEQKPTDDLSESWLKNMEKWKKGRPSEGVYAMRLLILWLPKSIYQKLTMKQNFWSWPARRSFLTITPGSQQGVTKGLLLTDLKRTPSFDKQNIL